MTDICLEDVLRFRAENALNADEDTRIIWMAQLGSFVMPLPNFKWRRDVINHHDAHHLLTGYAPTVSGELALAAWELGVKCYSDWRAKALCRLLMMFGLVAQPRLTLTAYRKGLSEVQLYKELYDADIFGTSRATVKASPRY